MIIADERDADLDVDRGWRRRRRRHGESATRIAPQCLASPSATTIEKAANATNEARDAQKQRCNAEHDVDDVRRRRQQAFRRLMIDILLAQEFPIYPIRRTILGVELRQYSTRRLTPLRRRRRCHRRCSSTRAVDAMFTHARHTAAHNLEKLGASFHRREPASALSQAARVAAAAAAVGRLSRLKNEPRQDADCVETSFKADRRRKYRYRGVLWSRRFPRRAAYESFEHRQQPSAERKNVYSPFERTLGAEMLIIVVDGLQLVC